MNWMRGLLRLWAVLSVIWVALVLALTQPWNAFLFVPAVATEEVRADPENPFTEYLDDPVIAPAVSSEQANALNSARTRVAIDGATRVALAAIVPPGILLLLLMAGRWVALGFRRHGEP